MRQYPYFLMARAFIVERRSFFSLMLLAGLSFNFSGCVPLVEPYIVAEAGYLQTERDLEGQTKTAETNSAVYAGGIGIGLDLPIVYAGAELNLAFPTGDDEVTGLLDSAGGDTDAKATIEEKWVVSAVADVGLSVSESWMIFARAGYVYAHTDISWEGVGTGDFDDIEENFNNAAFGGGIEYEIGLGLGVRAYYLRLEGDRSSNDIRASVIWRF